MQPQPCVTILTSGIGLGVYMPALLLQRRMRALGIDVEVEVLEGYYTADGRTRHLAHKQAFHDSFDLALIGHRMTRSVDGSLDHARVDELLGRWRAQRRTSFIVWSGFWLPILEQYRVRAELDLAIDCCRIDAQVSASFRVHAALERGTNEIWLWNAEQQRTVFEILVDGREPVPFAARMDRLVVHGGGWGIGTYRDAIARMHATQWAFDIVVHDRAEAANARAEDRCFMVDPQWRAWQRDNGAHVFPPFGPIESSSSRANEHALYEIIRSSKAIISKPGGGTLIDSLSSATPVILLEPYGYAEASNGEVWQRLGFGIPFAAWRDAGYRDDVLQELHGNLSRRARGREYAVEYVQRLQRGAAR